MAWVSKFSGLPTLTDIPLGADSYAAGVFTIDSTGDASGRNWGLVTYGDRNAPRAYVDLSSISASISAVLRVTARCSAISAFGNDSRFGVALYGPGADDACLVNMNLFDPVGTPGDGVQEASVEENGTDTQIGTDPRSGDGAPPTQHRLYWNGTGSAFIIPDSGFGSWSIAANTVSYWSSHDDGTTWTRLADRAIAGGVAPTRAAIWSGQLIALGTVDTYTFSNLEVMEDAPAGDPPEMGAVSPINGATNVQLLESISVEITDPDDDLDVSTVTIDVDGLRVWESDAPANGWSGSKTSITDGYRYDFPEPPWPFPKSKNITVNVAADDAGGNGPLNDSFQFTTAGPSRVYYATFQAAAAAGAVRRRTNGVWGPGPHLAGGTGWDNPRGIGAAVAPNGDVYAYCLGGGGNYLLRSINFGGWTNVLTNYYDPIPFVSAQSAEELHVRAWNDVYIENTEEIMRWDGSSFSSMYISADFKATALWVFAPNDIVAVGTNAAVTWDSAWHWDGVSWTRVYHVNVGSAQKGGLCLFSPDGSRLFRGRGRGEIHYSDDRGASWNRIDDAWSGDNGYSVRGAWGMGPEDMWFAIGGNVASGVTPTIVHWNGSTWTEYFVNDNGGGGENGIHDIFGFSNTEIVATQREDSTTAYVYDPVGDNWTATEATGGAGTHQTAQELSGLQYGDDAAKPAWANENPKAGSVVVGSTNITVDVVDHSFGVGVDPRTVMIYINGVLAWRRRTQQTGFVVTETKITNGYRYAINPDTDFDPGRVRVRVKAGDLS